MEKKGNLVLGNSIQVLRLDTSIHPTRPRWSKDPGLCQTKPNILPQSDVISIGKSVIGQCLQCAADGWCVKTKPVGISVYAQDFQLRQRLLLQARRLGAAGITKIFDA
jgi:hypothetical protein